MSKLTDAAIRKASRTGLLTDGGGLYLSVTPKKDRTHAKSWLVRYTAPDGRRREMGLGAYPAVGLAAARRAAEEKRRIARSGIDPLEERDRAARFPVFGDTAVGEVDVGFVTRAIDPIWNSKPETARRLRGRIESVLDWAIVRGHRDGPNPARWRGHLDKVMPKVGRDQRVKHHAALAFDQMPEFMRTLSAMDGVASRALEFCILTATRTGEVLNATWDEIDVTHAVWTIPEVRMKSGREHRVPLSSAALDLLKRLPAPACRSGFVFPGMKVGKPLSNMAMLMMLRRMDRVDLTAHGFRSTFRDWTAERSNFPREVAEAALAHVVPNPVEAAYRRGDFFEKRRRLMEAWGGYCSRSIARDVVTNIRVVGEMS